MTAVQTTRARVLIVDDHPTFCEGLASLFERTDDFEIVGKAWTSAAALSEARAQHPDLILLDVAINEGETTVSGLDLVHQLRRICPGVKIAIVTAQSGNEYLMSAINVGVEGSSSRSAHCRGATGSRRRTCHRQRETTDKGADAAPRNGAGARSQ
jgi:DNA-binding NarL/FixJ family response regulator